jgi:hypothetical protein
MRLKQLPDMARLKQMQTTDDNRQLNQGVRRPIPAPETMSVSAGNHTTDRLGPRLADVPADHLQGKPLAAITQQMPMLGLVPTNIGRHLAEQCLDQQPGIVDNVEDAAALIAKMRIGGRPLERPQQPMLLLPIHHGPERC